MANLVMHDKVDEGHILHEGIDNKGQGLPGSIQKFGGLREQSTALSQRLAQILHQDLIPIDVPKKNVKSQALKRASNTY